MSEYRPAVDFVVEEDPKFKTVDKPTSLAAYRMEATKKTVNERLREENTELKAILGRINQNTEAAYKNEQYTRKRLDTHIADVDRFWHRGFKDRLRWLLLGR